MAKVSAENPDITERFHFIIAGSEVGQGYSELNDPIDQRERFEAQEKMRKSGDKEAQPMDEDFVEALEYKAIFILRTPLFPIVYNLIFQQNVLH